MRRSYPVKRKLEAIEFAESNTNEAASRHFNVDSKRIRDWRKQKDQLQAMAQSVGGISRKKLSGGGRKMTSQDMENMLVDWILEKRSGGNRVSRKMIRIRAKELFEDVDDATSTSFQASTGWLQKFMDRNGFTNRRVTSVAQKTPSACCEKIASFILYAGSTRKKYEIANGDIIAMDETAVFFDMISNTTVEKKGASSVTVKSTGHEKSLVTVVLAAKADGVKLKPFIVFKQAIREVKNLQNTIGAKIVSTHNGWMNEDTTCNWLDSVVGSIGFKKRLLCWDSYRCHLSGKVKQHLKSFNVCTVVVPGGTTKYLQAPDLSWNKPFKNRIREMYDDWLASDDDKEYTTGGNLKAPNKRLVVDWIVKSWKELSTELIRNSFKNVGLTTALDGSEDNLIHCMKDGQPCRDAWNILQGYRDSDRETDMNIEPEVDIDEDETEQNEIVIDNDDE